MSTKTVYLDVTINLTDKLQVDRLSSALPLFFSRSAGWVNLTTGGFNGDVFAAPTMMAAHFNAPLVRAGAVAQSPCITSPYITSLAQTTFPLDAPNFDVKSGGWFGISWLFGTTTHYIWRGRYAFMAAATPQEPNGPAPGDPPTATPPPTAISQRTWIEGFEFPEQGSGGSGAFGGQVSRVASRHVDGYGLAIRGSDGAFVHTVTEFGAAARGSSWERLYIRLVNPPSADTIFWRARGSADIDSGCALAITPTGRIKSIGIDNDGTQTSAGTSDPLTVGTWYKLDLFFGIAAGSVRINGVQKLTLSFYEPLLGQNHLQSEVGGGSGVAANNLGLDIDDWFCAPIPAYPNGVDYRYGSKMLRVDAEDFGSTMANWTGDVRVLNKTPEEVSDTIGLVSTTSGARLAVTTNAEEINGVVGSLGVAAICISIFNKKSGAEHGTLGYSIAGNAPVLASIVQPGTINWNSRMYRPSGMMQPAPVTPLELMFEKAANGSNATIYSMGATVELVGTFGAEDVAPTTTGVIPKTVAEGTGIHNSPYPRSPFASLAGRPEAPVVFYSGTYVGNGTGQDLTFRTPVNWLFVRHVDNANGGSVWFSSMNGGHPWFAISFDPLGAVNVGTDPTFDAPVTGGTHDQATRTRVRIAADETNVNANGETYHYIAISDPGMRFMLNGSVAYFRGTADKVTNLFNDNFLPVAGFFQRETRGGASTGGLYYKGPGHATSTASRVDQAETASLVNWARGKVTSKSALHLDTSSTISGIPFSLFRLDDNSGDAGIVRTFAIFSYTGDGSGNRDIAITPTPGKFALAAFITPHNGATVYRDGSHTGTVSTQFVTSTLASTGIREFKLNAISVGSALNANGVTYDVFCIVGGDAAPTPDPIEIEPVEPRPPDDGPWPPEPTSDPVDPGGEGPITPVLPPGDFETGCVATSTKAINQALAFLGVSNPVVDITTEASTEATLARLYFSDDIETVLRDFAWPFATRYRELDLVAGTATVPANRDWQYAYRLPTDCAAARRLCSDKGLKRKFDPDPPKFRLGSDLTGGLLFTDIEDPELEYTARLPCPLGFGDAMFRLAFAWKLASSLAPSISRNKLTAADCLKNYYFQVNQAEVRAAREQQQEPQGDADWIKDRE